MSYDWILTQQERVGLNENDVDMIVDDICSKIFNIFIERSHTIFSEDDVLMWLREIIGYTLNKMDSEELTDIDILAAQLQSGIVDVQFSWNRYTSLKTGDFSDNQQVVAAEELMAANPDVNM